MLAFHFKCIVLALLCVILFVVLWHEQSFSASTQSELTLTKPCSACTWRFNEQDSSEQGNDLGVTGRLANLEKKREFTGTRPDFSSTRYYKDPLPPVGPLLCDKWIVVTTIFDPTTTILKLQNLSGWCLAVVGDKKTPQNFYLSSDSSVYLDPDQQESLGYKSLSNTPWNSFSRKNIGYIYAIHHGAKVIYDTDDDNVPKSDNIKLPGSRFSATLAHVQTPVWNPYPSFSYIEGWPRGFPLEWVSDPASLLNPVIVSNTIEFGLKDAGVWQLLADGDPDVDAILRLTKGTPHVNFCDAKPVVIPSGVMTPYNAQSTIHNYNAFWGMLLPQSVHGRVSDIWRSYFTERLLWDIGSHLGFLPPQVDHERSEHNYLQDFQSEFPLYHSVGELVKYLLHWKCSFSREVRIDECLFQLYVDMFEKGILEESDVYYVQDWINDLLSVGYNFSSVLSQGSQWLFEDFSKVRLCVQFDTYSSVNESSFKVLHERYSKLFDHISYTAPGKKPSFMNDSIDYIECLDEKNGVFQHICLLAHLEHFSDEEGYLYISDDSFVDFARLLKLPRNKVWTVMPQIHNITFFENFDYHWVTVDYYERLVEYHKSMTESEKANIMEITGHEHLLRVCAVADHIYIPGQLRDPIVQAIKKALKYNLHCELAMPMVFDSVVGADQIYFSDCDIWGNNRNIDNLQSASLGAKCDYIHPFKLATSEEEVVVWNQLMDDMEEILKIL